MKYNWIKKNNNYNLSHTKGHLVVSKLYKNGSEEVVFEEHNVIVSGMGVGIAQMMGNPQSFDMEDYKINLFQIGASGQSESSSLTMVGDPLKDVNEYGHESNVKLYKHEMQVGVNKATVPASGEFGFIPQNQIKKTGPGSVEFTIVLDDESCNNIKRDDSNSTINEIGLFMRNPLNRSTPEPCMVAYKKFNPVFKTADFALVFRWTINFADYTNTFDARIWWHPTGQAWNLIKNGLGLGPYTLGNGDVLDARELLTQIDGMSSFVVQMHDAPAQALENIGSFLAANNKMIQIETGGVRGPAGSSCTYLPQAEKDLDKVIIPLVNAGMPPSSIVMRMDNCLAHCVSAPLGAEEARAAGATPAQAFARHTETYSGISIEKNPKCGSGYSVTEGTTSSFVLAQMFLYMSSLNSVYPGLEFAWDEGIGHMENQLGSETHPSYGPYPCHGYADEVRAGGHRKSTNVALFDHALAKLATSCTDYGVNFRSFIGDSSLKTILYQNETPAAKLTGWSSIGDLGWRKLASTRQICHENNVRYGMLLNYSGGICSACTNNRYTPDPSFVSGTLAYYDGMVASGQPPDEVYPESWWCFPKYDFSSQGSYSQQYLMDELLKRCKRMEVVPTVDMVDIIKTERWGFGVTFGDNTTCFGVNYCEENCSTDGTENSTWSAWSPAAYTEYIVDDNFHTSNVDGTEFT